LLELQEEIVEEILPKRPVDARNCTIEIRQAAGGSESSLFAEDIWNMYKEFCDRKGWRFMQEEFTIDFAINKGCKTGVFKVHGEDVYKHFKHESGIHK
jgi:peptide chain release factor 1